MVALDMKVKRSGNRKKKKEVAGRASDLVEDSMVLGLGTGSTVGYLIKKLGKKIEKEDISLKAICSSFETKKRAIEANIQVTSFEQVKEIDLAIDGADQVDEDMNLIKGGGAAHLREKVLAIYSEEFVCIIDDTKFSDALDIPVPSEVLPFSHKPVLNKLEEIGVKASIRGSEEKDGPIISDNGNFIIDTDFGEIKEPRKLSDELKEITGLLEHGIFTGLADKVLIAREDNVKLLE